jgi:hypothetical protein
LSIGASLAKEGHTAILTSDSPETADYHIMQGIQSVSGKHKAVVYYSEEPSDPKDADRHRPPFMVDGKCEFAGVEITDKECRGPWHVAHVAAIKEADLVIMIGGSRRSAIIGHLARTLGKATLPLPYFGGEAKTVWREFEALFNSGQLTQRETDLLIGTWRDDSARTVTSVGMKLYQNSISKRNEQKYLLLTCFLAVICLLGWAVAFIAILGLSTNPGTMPWVFFLFFCLSLTSVFLGTSLRVCQAELADPLYQIKASPVLAEVTRSLIVSFAFILLSFVGGFIFTGEIKRLAKCPCTAYNVPVVINPSGESRGLVRHSEGGESGPVIGKAAGG